MPDLQVEGGIKAIENDLIPERKDAGQEPDLAVGTRGGRELDLVIDHQGDVTGQEIGQGIDKGQENVIGRSPENVSDQEIGQGTAGQDLDLILSKRNDLDLGTSPDPNPEIGPNLETDLNLNLEVDLNPGRDPNQNLEIDQIQNPEINPNPETDLNPGTNPCLTTDQNPVTEVEVNPQWRRKTSPIPRNQETNPGLLNVRDLVVGQDLDNIFFLSLSLSRNSSKLDSIITNISNPSM